MILIINTREKTEIIEGISNFTFFKPGVINFTLNDKLFQKELENNDSIIVYNKNGQKIFTKTYITDFRY
jgi:hypothetical protein